MHPNSSLEETRAEIPEGVDEDVLQDVRSDLWFVEQSRENLQREQLLDDHRARHLCLGEERRKRQIQEVAVDL